MPMGEQRMRSIFIPSLITSVAPIVSFAVVLSATARPMDANTGIAEAVVAENRSCHDYMSKHPDVAKGYGTKVSIDIDSYCDCEANLLVGSVAPDEVIRLKVD